MQSRDHCLREILGRKERRGDKRSTRGVTLL